MTQAASERQKQALFNSEETDRMSTEDLLKAYKQTGNEAYKWPLVLRYEGLIKSAALQARGVYSSFAQVDDIISEGILTLLRAIDKFDPEKGIKFETFISKRIRGMIIDLARKQDWVPRNVRQQSKQIDQAVSELYSEQGRFPTDEEIAGRLGISVEKYHKDVANAALGNVLSLDALIDMGDMDRERFEVPSGDREGQPEAAFQERELQEVLAQGIRSLRENEQMVLSLYYEKNLHMKDIAQIMEVSEPRISQIHARAIQKLRVYLDGYMNSTGSEKKKIERRL